MPFDPRTPPKCSILARKKSAINDKKKRSIKEEEKKKKKTEREIESHHIIRRRFGCMKTLSGRLRTGMTGRAEAGGLAGPSV
jgi:hypothetical protein